MNKKTTIIITALLLLTFAFYLNTNSTETIPEEDSLSKDKLSQAIIISKLSIDKGITELNNLSDLSDYTDYKRKYILAQLYEKKNDINHSISILESLLNKNYPLKERVFFHYARLNTTQGNDTTAIKTFRELIKNFQKSKSVPQAMYYLAQAELRARFTEQAIETLKSLRNHYPQTQYGIATNYYLGEFAYNKKDYNEALNFWRVYLKQSPDGRFANEISNFITYNKEVKLKPSDYSLLGDVFFHKKDYQNAAQFYRIEGNKKKYYQLGYSLFRTNNQSEAINYFKEYAYSFPRIKNVRWALYYAALCTPYYQRKNFWAKVTKDLPSLAYYSSYKESLLETSSLIKEHKLKNLIKDYPDSDFLLDAVWEILWKKIKEKNYTTAIELGDKYFFNTKNPLNLKSETRAKIGFWLGKIAEIRNQRDTAVQYYTETKGILPDNYYSLRAQNRLIELAGNKEPKWSLQNNSKTLSNINWSIPEIIKQETLKNHYGVVISELINLQQYDEAIDLIGKNKSPSKQVTAWLEALNSEYEPSINTATSLVSHYNLNINHPAWKLAYPLYYWQYIIDRCKNYPNLDPFFVCGLIRQESRFDTKATSISNAHGLMQFIPPTAKSVAKQINVPLHSQEDLHNPEINIALGTHYINGLISEFNNPLFAIASYNAGPNAVKRWINQKNINDLDLFIEEVPYEETRGYIKKVFANYWTYINLYKRVTSNPTAQ